MTNFRRLDQRHGLSESERRDYHQQKAIKEEAQRQSLRPEVVATAALLVDNLPRRGVSREARSWACLVVAAWALHIFIDLNRNGWKSAAQRRLTFKLAFASGVQQVRYSASDYIVANATIVVPRPPWTEMILNQSEIIVATMLADNIPASYGGNPRVIAGAILFTLCKRLSFKDLARALDVSVGSILRTKFALGDLIKIDDEGAS